MKKWGTLTEEQIQEIWETSKSKKEFLERLGYSWSGNVFKRISQNYDLKIENLAKQIPDIVINYKGYAIKNLQGIKIDKITVLNYNREYSKEKQSDYWNVICDCGNTYKPVLGVTIKRKDIHSCGCLTQQINTNKGVNNLLGQTFGKWKVLSRDITKSGNGAYWICECQCGNKTIRSVSGHSLINGTSQSCGCYHPSNGEEKIKQSLIDLQINFKQQYSFKELHNNKLKFDFAIFNNQQELISLIEYQGQQHYEPIEYFGGIEKFKQQQINDNLKKEYCQNNNIKLIEIPYYDYNKINKDYLLHKMQITKC